MSQAFSIKEANREILDLPNQEILNLPNLKILNLNDKIDSSFKNLLNNLDQLRYKSSVVQSSIESKMEEIRNNSNERAKIILDDLPEFFDKFISNVIKSSNVEDELKLPEFIEIGERYKKTFEVFMTIIKFRNEEKHLLMIDWIKKYISGGATEIYTLVDRKEVKIPWNNPTKGDLQNEIMIYWLNEWDRQIGKQY